MKNKSVTKKIKVNFPVVNTDTGELINAVSINVPVADKVIINYDNYTTIFTNP